MKMKCFMTCVVLGLLVIMPGCEQGTSGGPGASTPPVKERMGQTDDTFSLTTPSVKLNQGEAKTVSVEIKRGENFSEDVSLKIADLPTGVTLDPVNPVIKHGQTEVKLTLTAADDAALGDFSVNVTGHPTEGADGKSEIKLTIAKLDVADTADTTDDAAQAKRDDYTAAMQTQWDQAAAKFAALQDRAAKAEGQAKEELDQKVAEAKKKLDAAAVKLAEAKSASADRWEKVKEGASNAFEDLKTMFE